MEQRNPSAATAVLLELLAEFSRREIHGALGEVGDPERALIEGEVATLLRQGRTAGNMRMRPGFDAGGHLAGQQLAGFYDAHFPPLLRHIADPPLVLFYRGDLDVLQQPTVALIGARRCSAAGRQQASQLAVELAAAGCCIVSGLASGIDAAAHGGALQSRGLTAAFFGHGLSTVYPRWHGRLAEEIVARRGVLVSEYPASAPPRAFRFPERNRLISGVSMLVVVVEASAQSGSLITARLAAEQGKDVLACPGPATSPLSAGCHQLIRQGAGLVTSSAEVLAELGIEAQPARPQPALEGLAAVIYAAVGGLPVSAEEIALACDTSFEAAVAALVDLELNGFVRQQGLGYIRTS